MESQKPIEYAMNAALFDITVPVVKMGIQLMNMSPEHSITVSNLNTELCENVQFKWYSRLGIEYQNE